jgi:hypothetical protein
LFLEGLEAAETGVNGRRHVAGWRAACTWAHDSPEQAVVGVAAAVVADDHPLFFRHFAQVGDELLDWKLL